MKKLLKITVLIFIVIILTELAFMIYTVSLAKETLATTEVTLNKTKTIEVLLADLIIEPTEVDVILTNYYVNDSTGSGTVTSSGLTINDFQTNELGWYTYKGKVVIAAATYACLRATSGACAKYKTLPEGYSIFNLYDEITIIYDDKEYECIVLDSMGAGFWKLANEPYQRIDIFVAQTAEKFGKVVAQMQYYKED